MRLKWLALVGVLLALAAASYATARLVSRPPDNPGNVAPGFVVLHDYLQLTPRQRRELAEVDARYAATRPVLRERLWEARNSLLDVIEDPNSSREQAIAAVKHFGTAQQAMQTNTVEYTYELRKHLTPAQREKLVNTMGRGMCAMTGGPGFGRGMGGHGNGPHGPRGQCWRGGR